MLPNRRSRRLLLLLNRVGRKAQGIAGNRVTALLGAFTEIRLSACGGGGSSCGTTPPFTPLTVSAIASGLRGERESLRNSDGSKLWLAANCNSQMR